MSQAEPTPQENRAKNRDGRPVGPGNPPDEFRFRVGMSGNPHGRPRTKHITRAAERLVATKIPLTHPLIRQVPELKGKTWAEAILYGQTLAAVKGETPAANFVADRSEGKVAVELTGADGVPLFSDSDSITARALDLLAAARSRK